MKQIYHYFSTHTSKKEIEKHLQNFESCQTKLQYSQTKLNTTNAHMYTNLEEKTTLLFPLTNVIDKENLHCHNLHPH